MFESYLSYCDGLEALERLYQGIYPAPSIALSGLNVLAFPTHLSLLPLRLPW